VGGEDRGPDVPSFVTSGLIAASSLDAAHQ
jgi:hypothetical protein